jgi:hypothetical protein
MKKKDGLLIFRRNRLITKNSYLYTLLFQNGKMCRHIFDDPFNNYTFSSKKFDIDYFDYYTDIFIEMRQNAIQKVNENSE